MQNNYYSFKKFKKMPFLLSILFLVFSCFAFFLLFEKINNNQTTSEEMQKQWQDEKNRQSEVESLKTSIEAVSKEKILLESHFVQSSDIVPFLDTIERLALEAKAKSEVVSVEILQNTGELSAIINASGTFESVYKFLRLLENSPYEFEFDSVDMQKSGAQDIADKKAVSPAWEAVFKLRLLSFVQ